VVVLRFRSAFQGCVWRCGLTSGWEWTGVVLEIGLWMESELKWGGGWVGYELGLVVFDVVK
jgi:hypothetical protein